MKRIALSLLLAGTLLSNQLTAKAPLLLFRETSHFRVYCVENDQASAQKILARAEQDFAQLSRLFSHTYSTKINLNVFPSIPALHAHLGYPMAPSGQSMGPEWLINNTDTQNHTFSTVALTNPGTYHTAETILRFIITGMTDFFIKDAYKKPIPGWLIVGVGLWLTNSVMYQQQLATMAKNHALIPTFKQLTTDNPAEFGKRNGFACTYSVVDFINTTWGWEKVVALLADYAAMERILGINEETLRAQWITYLDKKYLNNK